MNHGFNRTSSLSRIPGEKYAKCLNPITPYKKSAIRVAISKKNTFCPSIKDNSITVNDSLIKRSQNNQTIGLSLSHYNKNLLNISPIKLKSKENAFYHKVKENLQVQLSDYHDPKKQYEVYIDAYNRVAEFLKPFDELLIGILEGIQNY